MICAEWTGKAYGVNRRLDTTRYGHVYTRADYKGFKQGLAWSLHEARKHCDDKLPYHGDVSVHIHMVVRHDIDACIKPVLDALELADVLSDDKQVRRLLVTMDKKRGRVPDRIRVTVDVLS
jgi:Holliday junction resolvase RusA-like endonuclease